MKITNRQLSVLVEGLTQLAVDVKNNTRRDLPFVSGVRLRRTLSHFNELFKPVRENLQVAQEKVDKIREDLTNKVKDESTDYNEKLFEKDFNEAIEDINKSLDDLLDDEVSIDTDNLITLIQLEDIGNNISGGVPQQSIDAYLLLEKLLKTSTDEHTDDTK